MVIHYKQSEMLKIFIAFCDDVPSDTEYYILVCPECIYHKQMEIKGDYDCKNVYVTPEGNEGQCCCYAEEHK